MRRSHIDVGSVLRTAVAGGYSNLVTRPTGAAVRQRIEQVLAGGGCVVAEIDFGGVAMMDFSCADEIVAKLVLNTRPGGPRFIFCGLSESHIEAIEAVLERHGLTLASHEADANSYVAVPH